MRRNVVQENCGEGIPSQITSHWLERAEATWLSKQYLSIEVAPRPGSLQPVSGMPILNPCFERFPN